MRKLIVLLMVVLLPLQTGLAAVAAFGPQHEQMHALADCDGASGQDGAGTGCDSGDDLRGSHCHATCMPLIAGGAAISTSVESSLPRGTPGRTDWSFEPEPLEPVPLARQRPFL